MSWSKPGDVLRHFACSTALLKVTTVLWLSYSLEALDKVTSQLLDMLGGGNRSRTVVE